MLAMDATDAISIKLAVDVGRQSISDGQKCEVRSIQFWFLSTLPSKYGPDRSETGLQRISPLFSVFLLLTCLFLISAPCR